MVVKNAHHRFQGSRSMRGTMSVYRSRTGRAVVHISASFADHAVLDHPSNIVRSAFTRRNISDRLNLGTGGGTYIFVLEFLALLFRVGQFLEHFGIAGNRLDRFPLLASLCHIEHRELAERREEDDSGRKRTTVSAITE